MAFSLQDWLLFLKTGDKLMGLPLLLGGAVLMFFGWRLWKLCVVLSFGLIGAALVVHFVPNPEQHQLFIFAGGALLGGLSYFPANYSVAVLGGILGGGTLLYFLSGLGFNNVVYCAGGAAALLGATAYAFINRRLVVIVVTSMLGAMLLVSGLAVFVMMLPSLYGTLVAMSTSAAWVIPFLLLVPTVMSCFYQVAEVNRLQVEL